MEIEILSEGAFESALVQLAAGERFVSEAGAMYRASTNIDIDVTTRSRGRGGILGGAKRLLAGESFFLSTYCAEDGKPGEIGLAPTHQGELFALDVAPSCSWLCAGGSYLASAPELELNTQFQGIKGFLGGENLFFVEVSGTGPLLVSAFGRVVENQVDGVLTVDTGHVVAFESTLDYQITKAGKSWVQSWLAGEGLVFQFSGRGRLLTQSHNPSEFGRALGPMLPERS
ncbi:MAG: TIGR00266 family protein [Planctomycetota bacterium]|nr:TIGR00266 family protein [Planctomycetota bacterium]